MNDNETVAAIKKRVLRECNSFPLPNAAGEKLKLVREFDAAHKREIDGLRELVGEMVIALSGSLDIVGNVSEYLSLDCGTLLRVETYREILAKAREVTKL